MPCKLTIDATIAILVSLADHLVDLVISELLTNRSHDVTKLSSRNEAVVVAVEHLERLVSDSSSPFHSALEAHLKSLADLFLGVGILHLASHHGKKLYGRESVSSEVTGSIVRDMLWGQGVLTREVNSAIVVGIDLVDHVLKLRL